jgi:hypothetical protein
VEQKRQVKQERTPRERLDDLVGLLVPDWRPTGAQVLWGIRIAIGLIVLLGIFALIGDQYDKTIWDSAQLLLTASIPVVIAVVGNRYTQQRAQDDALQAFLDQIGELMLDKAHPLRSAPEFSDERILARARTLTVVERLDAHRKGNALGFLLEAGLLTPQDSSEDPVISLHQANLEGAQLSDFWLGGSSLFGANLKGANLSRARLMHAKWFGANLEGANLGEAYLEGTNLEGTNLEGANLRGAILDGANLGRANLRGANLYGDEITGVANEQELEERVGSLAGTTMPDGSKREAWWDRP